MPTETGPVYAPARYCMLSLTDRCNLRCSYCFVVKQPRTMTVETARKAVDYFMSRNVSGAEYTIGITFFGGEPFLELDLMEAVIAYAREPRPNTYKQIVFSATTGGTIATRRVERIIREAGMSLLVSLDGGPDASRHRPMASGRESLPHVAANLPRFVSWSPDTVVRMTYHPDTLDLVGNVRAVLSMGAPSVVLAPVQEADWRGREDALQAAYETLAEWYVEEARRGRLLPLEITHVLLRQYHAVRSGGPSRPARPCSVGSALIGIDPEGHVMPCHRFLYRSEDWLGTVDRPDWSEKRWQYVHLDSKQILGCDTCLAAPVCGGGCRAVALNAGLGLHGAHPGHCVTMRAHARAVYHIYDVLMSEGNGPLLNMLRSPRPLGGLPRELLSA